MKYLFVALTIITLIFLIILGSNYASRNILNHEQPTLEQLEQWIELKVITDKKVYYRKVDKEIKIRLLVKNKRAQSVTLYFDASPRDDIFLEKIPEGLELRAAFPKFALSKSKLVLRGKQEIKFPELYPWSRFSMSSEPVAGVQRSELPIAGKYRVNGILNPYRYGEWSLAAITEIEIKD